MIKLTIDNSTSSVLGLNVTQFKELSELMSYSIDPQAAYFSKDYRTRKRSLLTKRGDFPTGLLYIIEGYFKKKRIDAVVNDVRIRPVTRLNALKIDFLDGTMDLPNDFKIKASRGL